MRIMQRPQGKAKYKTKEDLKKFMNKIYIENVWCFTKVKDLDYFKLARINTLENLFI